MDESSADEVIRDVATRLLDLQLSFADALDSKTGLFISVASALLPVLPAIAAIKGVKLDIWLGLFLLASGAAFAVCAVQALGGLRSRMWYLGPESDGVIRAAESGEHPLTRLVAASMRRADEMNQPIYNEKLASFRRSLYALIAEAVIVYAGLGFLVARG